MTRPIPPRASGDLTMTPEARMALADRIEAEREQGREAAAFRRAFGGMSHWLSDEDAGVVLAALRATEPPVPVDREKGDLISRTAAMDAILALRHAAACNFTPAYSGSLGEARCNSFYEAAQAVRLLPASASQAPQQRTDTGEVGDV